MTPRVTILAGLNLTSDETTRKMCMGHCRRDLETEAALRYLSGTESSTDPIDTIHVCLSRALTRIRGHLTMTTVDFIAGEIER
jgi:hypothetical protein